MGLLYTSIRVKDMKKSVAFYKYLGMKVIGRRSFVPGERIVMLVSKETGQRLNLMWFSKNCMWYKPWKNDGVELDHLMFEVKDANRDVWNSKQSVKQITDEAVTKIAYAKDMERRACYGIWLGWARWN